MDDLNLREYKRSVGHQPQDYCSFVDPTATECIKSEQATFDFAQCDCRPSCNERNYKGSISSLRWPSNVACFFKAIEYDIG